jgi:hypothetical protein
MCSARHWGGLMHGGTADTRQRLAGCEPGQKLRTSVMLHRFAAEHEELRDTIGLLRDRADRLAAGPDAVGLESLTVGGCPTGRPGSAP